MHAAGGAVICAGSDYSGSFSDCCFRSAAFYAVHGAAVTLRGCRFLDCHPAVTASGAATVATLTTCTLSRSICSLLIEHQATLIARDCQILSTESAVLVNGPGSTVVLDGCELRGGRSAHFSGTAVAACGGCARLHSCTLCRFGMTAFSALRSACIEAVEVAVSETLQGVVLAAHSRATMRECHVQLTDGPGAPVPMAAYLGASMGFPGHACMQFERCRVYGGVATAARVFPGASLSAMLCRFECVRDIVATGDNGGRAVLTHCSGDSRDVCFWLASAAALLRLEGGSYVSNKSICSIVNGAVGVLKGCDVRGRCAARMEGVVGLDSSTVWLHKCRIRDGVAGVHARNSTVRVSDTEVSDLHALVPDRDDETGQDLPTLTGGGAFVCLSSRVTIKRGLMQRCVIGVVAENVAGNPGVVHVTGAKFANCVRGVQVRFGSEVHVSRCEFRGLGRVATPKDFGYGGPLDAQRVAISYRQQAGGSVRGCTFEGFWGDVAAGSSKGVEIQNCSFRGTIGGGTSLLATGVTVVEDCSFTGTNGVRADEVADCRIRRCTFERLDDCAVTAADGAVVKVTDHTKIDTCQVGLKCVGSAELAVQDCRLTLLMTGISMSGGVLAAKRVHAAAHNFGIFCACRSGAPATLKLVDSSISGALAGVSVGEVGVTATMLRCEVTCSHTGIITSGKVTVRMRECKVTECSRGVTVGDNEDDMKDICVNPACRQSGSAGVRAARQALLDTVAGVRAAGMCPHQGSVARMTMADVKFSDCDEAGVWVNPHGWLDATRVTARMCETGFHVERVAERSRFVDCEVIMCLKGVVGWQVVSPDPSIPMQREEVAGVREANEKC